jgi:protein-S-isoprenylcysteine O-methyltransferase Ste14
VLVQGGPYAIVRHPGYLGSLLVAVGVAIASGSFAALVLIILSFVATHLYRISAEEKMMLSTFGEQYREYSQKTTRLLPWIY